MLGTPGGGLTNRNLTGQDGILASRGQFYVNPTPSLLPAPTSLLYGDDFDGPANSLPDNTVWTARAGRYSEASGELEYYTNASTNSGYSNYYLDGNSNLVIACKTENPPDNSTSMPYTSARIDSWMGAWSNIIPTSTNPMRVTARIQFPSTKGIWPAFWMEGNPANSSQWPGIGEIDIADMMNYWGNTVTSNHFQTTIHAPKQGTTSTDQPLGYNVMMQTSFNQGFHIFGVDWYIDKLLFHLDGNLLTTITEAQYTAAGGDWTPFSGAWPWYILLNCAVGAGGSSHYPDSSSLFPQYMLVDWVRVYNLGS